MKVPVENDFVSSGWMRRDTGRVEVMKWWARQQGYSAVWGTLGYGFYFGEWICRIAAEYGQFQTLQWLTEKGCSWDADTCAAAAYNGDLSILQWVRENGCDWDNNTCAAARGGHLSILQLWERTAAARTRRLIQLLLKVDIYQSSNMQERTAAAGTRTFVQLLLKMAIFPSSDGQERTAAVGIVTPAIMLLKMAISPASDGPERTDAPGTRVSL